MRVCKECAHPGLKPAKGVDFAVSNAELHLIREWFDNVQDVNRIYLEPKDYALAKRVYEALGMRVPNSITENL